MTPFATSLAIMGLFVASAFMTSIETLGGRCQVSPLLPRIDTSLRVKFWILQVMRLPLITNPVFSLHVPALSLYQRLRPLGNAIGEDQTRQLSFAQDRSMHSPLEMPCAPPSAPGP
jgi:hypothetical protein